MVYPEPFQRYRHYKGGTYEIITMASNASDRSPMVVYRSVDFGSIYVRPLSEWEETVSDSERGVYQVPRFKLIP